VVFDLDGVIVASEHLWEEGWWQVSLRQGVDWTATDTRACQGKSVPEWAAYMAGRTGLLPDQARDQVIGHVTDAYDRGAVELLPFAVELVTGASRRVPIGLATSAPREVIERVLGFPEIGGCFEVTVSSAEVERGKPSPDVYRAAINRLGGDPAKSFAVEDSSNGIRAAAGAGLNVLGIEHQQYPIAPDAAALTVAVYSCLEDVAEHLLAGLDAAMRPDIRPHA
jgi:beta-phosphoglucomutase-like phosphatase (HAD superfamily)